ncbi:MAG: hypothetical protein WAJ84_01115, partial [Candidatus Rhabdochlamydia sp.]
VSMIYIDCEDNDTTLPIYIGQSRDIQKRYKDHLTELLTLNRLSYDTYRSYFFDKDDSFYEGSFKATKIFKFMVEQNCDITQFRMKILTECDINLLDHYEEFYLQKFLSSYFGFNQLESFLKNQKMIRSIRSIEAIEEVDISRFLKTVEDDIKGVRQYYEYGFTKFNFEHAMSDNISYLSKEVTNDNIRTEVARVQKELVELHESRKPGYPKILKLRKQVNSSLETKRIVSEGEEDFTRSLTSKIKDLLSTDKLKKSDSEPLGRFFIKHEEGKISTMSFFKHSFTRGLLKEHYSEDVDKLIQVKAKSKETYDAYLLESNKLMKHLTELRKKRYKLIFPLRSYDIFPLKSLPIEHSSNILPRTQIHIHFDLTNNGQMRSVIPKYTDVIRVVISNVPEQKQSIYYIENETMQKILEGISYIEKDFNNMMAFIKQRFSLSSRTNEYDGPTQYIEDYDNSFISVSSEYKHVVNDYVLKNKNLIKLSDVFDDVYSSLSDKTVVNYSCSESKKCLNKALIRSGVKEHPLLERLRIKFE